MRATESLTSALHPVLTQPFDPRMSPYMGPCVRWPPLTVMSWGSVWWPTSNSRRCWGQCRRYAGVGTACLHDVPWTHTT
jgi:hypothetical protein